METRLEFDILPQPDNMTCGPTCLHALYRYYGDELPLETVIEEVESLEGGGTLAVLLACHALRRGYDATIYTYNLKVLDPTTKPKQIDIVPLDGPEKEKGKTFRGIYRLEGDQLTAEDESVLYHHYRLNYVPSDRESKKRLVRH